MQKASPTAMVQLYLTGSTRVFILLLPKESKKNPLPIMPLLFEIKENGTAEEAFPKVYSVITLQGEVGSFTVKKVWIDDNDSYLARPVNVTVDLFRDGELYDTVVLDEASDWQYRWNTLDTDAEWRVLERNIPVKYAVLVDYNSKQFLIKNSYAPDIFIDGGEYLKTTTNSAAVSTTSTTVSAATTTQTSGLPQTGQLWWPVFPLVLGGMVLICIGILLKKKNNKNEK